MSSREISEATKQEKQKGTSPQGAEACQRDADKKQKEDPLVKWFPSHISKDPAQHPLIPFPKPPLKVELRGGNYIHICQCLKRDGLQSECPLTGCQGHKDCMQRFLPNCVPSGLRLPAKKPPFVQKADEPECYSKSELSKGYDKVMNETVTGGTGGIEGDRQAKSKTVVQKPPSIASLISEEDSKKEDTTEKKPVRIRPNYPPNYISEPAIFTYPAPCRHHATIGIPGSGSHDKFKRCRLRKGKTMPKVIAPQKSKTSLETKTE